MQWHFLVPQQNRKTIEFTEDDGRKFEVLTFSGSNERAGMSGDTMGCIVNLVSPHKQTVLFTRRYYSDGSKTSSTCEVSDKYFANIEEFVAKHNIQLFATPEKMLSGTDGHYFALTNWSNEFIKLHPDDPIYDAAEDPDVKEAEKKK